MTKTNNDTSNREIRIHRLINAPRELVFEVWTQPEHVKHWWGPDGFSNTIHSMRVKPGGEWHFIMHGPDGTDYPNRIVFNEVVKDERLVYTHSSDDPNDPHSFHTVVTFEQEGDKTSLNMYAIFKSAEERTRVVKESGADKGAVQTMNRLEAYLANMA
jgi:uncharacterized protein YndB with AHSA1/START domain